MPAQTFRTPSPLAEKTAIKRSFSAEDDFIATCCNELQRAKSSRDAPITFRHKWQNAVPRSGDGFATSCETDLHGSDVLKEDVSNLRQMWHHQKGGGVSPPPFGQKCLKVLPRCGNPLNFERVKPTRVTLGFPRIPSRFATIFLSSKIAPKLGRSPTEEGFPTFGETPQDAQCIVNVKTLKFS